MATLNIKHVTKLVLGALIGLTMACDKKSDSAPAVAAPAPTYGYVNGACYDTTNNTPVAANLCGAVVANGNYRYNGTQCVDLNNQPVAQNLCTNTGVNGNYRWNGTQCIDIHGSPVAAQLCQNVGQNGYQIVNGNCVSNQGMWVSYTYCSSVTGYNPNQCNGIYVKYYGAGMFGTIQCYGNSCSGQTLMEYYGNRQVVCP